MHCLVTGGSRGIGLAVAHKVASMGYGVTLCARNVDLLHQRKSELSIVRESQVHDVWPLDMADIDAVTSSQGVPRPLTDYTAFINCAGIAGSALTLVQSPKSIDSTLKVNLHSPILLAKNIGRAMLRNKNPSEYRKQMIFISSILASRGLAGSAVYGATKAGLESFARAFARECGSREIAVNSIAPGLVETEMGLAASPKVMESNVFPGLVSPEEIANTAEFLLKSNSITGQVITVDNGCSI